MNSEWTVNDIKKLLINLRHDISIKSIFNINLFILIRG